MTLNSEPTRLDDEVAFEACLSDLARSAIDQILLALVRYSPDFVSLADPSGNVLCVSRSPFGAPPSLAEEPVASAPAPWLESSVGRMAERARSTLLPVRERLVGIDETGHHTVDCIVRPILEPDGALAAT